MGRITLTSPRLERGISVQVLRKISAQNADALVPHLTYLVPPIVSLLQQTQGPTKLAGDRTLSRILQVSLACRSIWCPVFRFQFLIGQHVRTLPYMPCVLVQIDQGVTVVQDFLAMPGAGPTAKSYLTEACLRRLSRLPLSDDDDDVFQ